MLFRRVQFVPRQCNSHNWNFFFPSSSSCMNFVFVLSPPATITLINTVLVHVKSWRILAFSQINICLDKEGLVSLMSNVKRILKFAIGPNEIRRRIKSNRAAQEPCLQLKRRLKKETLSPFNPVEQTNTKLCQNELDPMRISCRWETWR